jgi:transcriptional regulator with XRE-family HTH domain
MANFLSSEKVSWPFHDRPAACWHTANMAKKTRTRWFLKQWRKHRGYTQDRLAEMTGLSKPYISQLESGKRQYTQELLELFAGALRCEPADLIIRDPSDPDGLWSVWDQLDKPERRQVVEIAKTIKRTGTEG